MADRDRDREPECGGAPEDEDTENRLRRVRHRRERVRREDRQRFDIRQSLVDGVLGRDRAAHEGAAHFPQLAARVAQLLARDEIVRRDLAEDLILRPQDTDVLVAGQRPPPLLTPLDLRHRTPPRPCPCATARPVLYIGKEIGCFGWRAIRRSRHGPRIPVFGRCVGPQGLVRTIR